MKLRRTRFNEKKATQVAARFLALASGEMPYISLIKLMYFTDREALLRWGSPLTNDDYFFLKNGPILSTVLDLITDDPELGTAGFWAQHISVPLPNHTVKLETAAGDDELSDAEDDLIKEIFGKYGARDKWDLVDLSHKLPEWIPPEGAKRIPVKLTDILKKNGLSDEDASLINDNLQSIRLTHSLLGAR